MSANVFSARLYQKECSIATARSKVGWTAGVHEVAKETFPSVPPGSSPSWARAARDETSRKDAETAKARRLALMWRLLGRTDGILGCSTLAATTPVRRTAYSVWAPYDAMIQLSDNAILLHTPDILRRYATQFAKQALGMLAE